MAIIRLREPREPLPQGEHHVQISGVTTLNDIETKFGPKKMIKVTFMVCYNGKTQTVSERYNVSTHPDSNMSRLLRVFYENIPYELDTDMLIGRECRVVIEHRTLSDGTPWNGVKEVLPPQQVTTATLPVETSTAAANNNAVVRTIRPRPSLAEAAARRARRDNLPVTDASPIFEFDQQE